MQAHTAHWQRIHEGTISSSSYPLLKKSPQKYKIMMEKD
jgi:hypothetical protein